MYVDRILLYKSTFPHVPQNILDFFREEELSIINLFLYLFTYAVDDREVMTSMNQVLSEVEFTTHDLTDDGYSYTKAIRDLYAVYLGFQTAASRQLGFLRVPPDGILVSNVHALEHGLDTILIELEFSERGSNAPLPHLAKQIANP